MNMLKSSETNKEFGFILKISSCLLVMIIAIGILYRLLLGDNIYYKDSRNKVDMATPTNSTIELTKDVHIREDYICNFDKINSISMKVGTYGRDNEGTIELSIYDHDTNEFLGVSKYEIKELSDGDVIDFYFDEEVSNVRGKKISILITSSSEPGSAISPLSSNLNTNDNTYYVADELVIGTVCMGINASDYIWLANYYWELMFLFLIAFVGYFIYSLKQYQKGKFTVYFSTIIAIKSYLFLIRQLVSKDFKSRYKRSTFGVVWSVISPLSTMLVQYFVFSNVFKSAIPFYAVYLLSGLVLFNMFNEACTTSMTSIITNTNLITKVYMPKFIYPLARIVMAFINFGFSLIPLIILSTLSGVKVRGTTFLAMMYALLLLVFAYGLGLVLATIMVYFRDIMHMWSIFILMWMYATPIFYPEEILPEQYRALLYLNPLYYFFKAVRCCFISGVAPDLLLTLKCIVISMLMFIIGIFVFQRNQNKFVLYL